MNKLKTAIRVTELDGLSDTLVRNFKADLNASSDAFLVETMKEIETLSAQITTAILQDKISSSLESADKARDEALKNFYTAICGYAAIPIAAKKEAALPVKVIADKYFKAGILSTTYVSKSSMIESLLEDLAAESVTPFIQVLEGIPESISEIRNAQDCFTKSNDEYIKANANKGASASSYKPLLLNAINNKLIPYLNAMIIAKNEKYLDFSKEIDAELARLNVTISQRSQQKKTAIVVS